MNITPMPAGETIIVPTSWPFRPERQSDGPTPWTAVPGAGPSSLRFAVVGDAAGLGRPGFSPRP